MTSTLDVDAMLKRISQASEQMFLCDASSIMLLDDDKTISISKSPRAPRAGWSRATK